MISFYMKGIRYRTVNTIAKKKQIALLIFSDKDPGHWEGHPGMQ